MPGWAWSGELCSVTRSADELRSSAARRPSRRDARAERGWRALKVEGPLDFSLTGVLASLAAPLADARISIFALSTYDTDYVLVRANDLAQACETLSAAGHTVVTLRSLTVELAAAGLRPPRLALDPVVAAPEPLARRGRRAPVVDPLLLALELLPGRHARRVALGAHRAARLAVVLAVGEATLRRELLDVGEGLGRRRRPPTGRPRGCPGVSISSAPLGSVSRSRVTVVWRPRPPLCSLTAPIAWRSKPSSALTSVDLPAPDGPSSTLVVCGSSRAASGTIESSSWTLTAMPSASPRLRAIVRAEAPPSGSRSAFVSTSAAGTPPAAASDDDPLAAALVGLGERLDDEHELDVRREHLARDRRAGRAAHDRAATLEHGGDDAVAVEGDPVAGRRGALARGAQATARGDEPRRRVAAVGDEPAAAVLGEHAGGGERWVAELARARRRDPVAARWRRMGHAR